MRDRNEAIEAAMLYVLRPSDKEHAKWSPLLPVAFVRALEQDGYTVESAATIAALRAALDGLVAAADTFYAMLAAGGPDGGDLDEAVEQDFRAALAAARAVTEA
jgi:hypothetical protein